MLQIAEPGIVMRCTCDATPIQFEGHIDGYPAYWRARYDRFQLAIATAPGTDPVDVACGFATGWYEERPYGEPGGYDAGFMPLDQAERLIREGVAMFRLSQQRGATV